MPLNEACQLWIEQRIEEELGQEDREKSLRQIGREIAAEIERVFEAKVRPEAITMRASRAVTNVTQEESATSSDTSTEIKQIKRQPAKDGTMRGGPRDGAGRKPKPSRSINDAAEKQESMGGASLHSWALDHAHVAISQLKRIEKNDPMRVEALHRVKDWVDKQLKG